jgi:hypothetical protein
MSKTLVRLAPLCAALALLLTVPAAGERALGSGDATWTARDAQTEWLLNDGLLADLGLVIESTEPSVLTDDGTRRFRFDAPPPSGLLFRTRDGIFDDLAGGRLVHRGGIELSWPGGSVSLVDFVAQPGPAPQTLEIRDTSGALILVADHMHFSFDPESGRLSMFNLDLRLSAPFAARLGEPRHAGLPIGQMRVDSALDAPVGFVPGEAGCSNPVWDADVDVGLLDMSSVTQTARQAGVRVAVTPSATLINLGTADVPWYGKFSGTFPPYNNDQHPFLIWNMFRISDGVIQQIGVSPLKHAFLTINSGCSCSSGNILWAPIGGPDHPTVGCTDTYGTGTNSSRGSLTERHEINPFTGIWKRCGSIFDPDCDGNQNTPPTNGDFDRRMAVAESDLQVAGAEYYVEAWYVVREDIDIFNTMGYRKVNPVLAGSTWSFNTQTPLISGPVINRWVDPAAPDAGTQNVVADTGEGHLQLAVRATDLGGGQWRYEYALQNHDFDRQLESFSVPLSSSGGAPSDPPTLGDAIDLVFADADVDPANDWSAATEGGMVTWTAPDAESGLDWGRLYRFGFTSSTPPTNTTASYGILEGGGSGTIATLAPGSADLFADGFETGDTSAWSSVVE